MHGVRCVEIRYRRRETFSRVKRFCCVICVSVCSCSIELAVKGVADTAYVCVRAGRGGWTCERERERESVGVAGARQRPVYISVVPPSWDRNRSLFDGDLITRARVSVWRGVAGVHWHSG